MVSRAAPFVHGMDVCEPGRGESGASCALFTAAQPKSTTAEVINKVHDLTAQPNKSQAVGPSRNQRESVDMIGTYDAGMTAVDCGDFSNAQSFSGGDRGCVDGEMVTFRRSGSALARIESGGD